MKDPKQSKITSRLNYYTYLIETDMTKEQPNLHI